LWALYTINLLSQSIRQSGLVEDFACLSNLAVLSRLGTDLTS